MEQTAAFSSLMHSTARFCLEVRRDELERGKFFVNIRTSICTRRMVRYWSKKERKVVVNTSREIIKT